MVVAIWSTKIGLKKLLITDGLKDDVDLKLGHGELAWRLSVPSKVEHDRAPSSRSR